MKILKNFDPKKIAKAKSKIFWAIASISLMSLVCWFPELRLLALRHPGLIGVFVAVTGEVYFDWKDEIGRKGRWKKFFMALLVVSLAYELIEASESDRKAANAIELAGQANERAATSELHVAVLSNQTVRLSMNLEEQKSNNFVVAKELFGLTTQANEMNNSITQLFEKVSSPEISAKLNEAKTSLAAANRTIEDVKTILTNSNLTNLASLKPKSLQERIIDCLNSIDPNIIEKLSSSSTVLPCSGEVETTIFSELKKLAAEPGGWKYLQIQDNNHSTLIGPDANGEVKQVLTDVKLWVYPELLKK